MKPATFAEYLKTVGMSPKTQRTYLELIRAAENAQEDPIDRLVRWNRDKVSRGSVLPMRSAVIHLCRYEGLTEEQIEGLVPKPKGRPIAVTTPLTPRELNQYMTATASIRGPISRAAARLLPMTGIQVSELVRLKRESFVELWKGPALHYYTKKKYECYAPLTPEAADEIKSLLAQTPDQKWLFPLKPDHLRVSDVQATLHQLSRENPQLPHINPQKLRATAIFLWLTYGEHPHHVGSVVGHRVKGSMHRWRQAYRALELNEPAWPVELSAHSPSTADDP